MSGFVLKIGGAEELTEEYMYYREGGRYV